MITIENTHFDEERALFFLNDAQVSNCTFSEGESPLKHGKNVKISNCNFISRYPVWYSNNIEMEGCTAMPDSRAGIWYTEDIKIKNCTIEAPKSIRRVKSLKLEDCSFPNGDETLWHCRDITISNASVTGDYFFMNSSNAEINGLMLNGKYSFDGAENVIIRNSTLISKDAFWNSKNITVYNSTVIGEYLGWNAENLTFIDCTLQSLQGFCYINNLVMKNCKTQSTTLAFEYSNVDADICGEIESVLNPSGGKISADKISELTLDPERVDTSLTEIIIKNK